MRLSGGKYPYLLILMAVLFGLTFIASKNALQGIGVFQLLFARYLIASVALTLILWKDRSRFHIARRDWKHFLLLTAIEPIGYFIFETYGVKYTNPSSVALLLATIPAFSVIFAAIMLKEKAGFLTIFGIFLSFIGVYAIFSVQPQSQLAPNPLLGNSMALGAAVSAGLYNAVCRRLTQTYSAVTITYYQAFIATLVFLPLAALERYSFQGFYLNTYIFLNILYLGVGSSVAAFLILNFALSRLQTSRVAIFANLIPVITIFASWLVYSELLKTFQLIGAGLIIGGVYLTYTRN